MTGLTEAQRFWPRVQQGPNGCWQWIGGTRSNGYGTFAVRVGGRWTQTTAHRWAYRELVGPIPAGYEVDHLCMNRGCVRDLHLEAVPLSENRRRRDQGHPFTFPASAEVPVAAASPTRLVTPGVSRPRARPRPVRVPPTHCRNGHERAVAGWTTNGPRPTCAACKAERLSAARKGNAAADRTHCPQGHEYTPENTYWHKTPAGQQHRECRTCVLARNRANYNKRRSA